MPHEPALRANPHRYRFARILRQLQHLLFLALIVGVVLLAYLFYSLNTRIDHVQTELAKRQQANDSAVAEAKTLAKQAFETLNDVQAKYGLLEGRITDSQSQQAALEQMYQELARNRDEWALAEVEQVLSTASQQLQLSGNVQGALIALANADMRLSHGDKPQFIAMRRAINRDIEKLKALPALDLAGLAVQIDELANQIDTLPMLTDSVLPDNKTESKPVVEAKDKATSKPVVKTGKGSNKAADAASNPSEVAIEVVPGPFEHIKDWLSQFARESANQVLQLVRVREVQKPDALYTSPDQAFFIRENIKLRLFNARLALLSRNEKTFRSDLAKAQSDISQYFDSNSRKTAVVINGLRQIQSSIVSIELPSLSDSLAAVRSYKPKTN